VLPFEGIGGEDSLIMSLTRKPTKRERTAIEKAWRTRRKPSEGKDDISLLGGKERALHGAGGGERIG